MLGIWLIYMQCTAMAAKCAAMTAWSGGQSCIYFSVRAHSTYILHLIGVYMRANKCVIMQ